MTFAGAVLILVISTFAFKLFGSTTLLICTAVLSIPFGIFIGWLWTVYPWQIAAIGSLPGWGFLCWRFLSTSDPHDAALNATLFAFLAMIAMASLYFGAFIGRWISIKKRMHDSSGEHQ